MPQADEIKSICLRKQIDSCFNPKILLKFHWLGLKWFKVRIWYNVALSLFLWYFSSFWGYKNYLKLRLLQRLSFWYVYFLILRVSCSMYSTSSVRAIYWSLSFVSLLLSKNIMQNKFEEKMFLSFKIKMLRESRELTQVRSLKTLIVVETIEECYLMACFRLTFSSLFYIP